MSNPMTIPTKALDIDTIATLLGEQKKIEDDRYVRKGEEQLFFVHNFDKKFLYLFDLPYEQMFVPWKSNYSNSDGYWHCIGCSAIVKNRESHFNWHKRELVGEERGEE
jgi:hypothetical protein